MQFILSSETIKLQELLARDVPTLRYAPLQKSPLEPSANSMVYRFCVNPSLALHLLSGGDVPCAALLAQVFDAIFAQATATVTARDTKQHTTHSQPCLFPAHVHVHTGSRPMCCDWRPLLSIASGRGSDGIGASLTANTASEL